MGSLLRVIKTEIGSVARKYEACCDFSAARKFEQKVAKFLKTPKDLVQSYLKISKDLHQSPPKI